jgi:hypothetical protein
MARLKLNEIRSIIKLGILIKVEYSWKVAEEVLQWNILQQLQK